MKTLTALQLISETCEKCGVKFNTSTGIITVTDLKIPKKFATTGTGIVPTILQVGADRDDNAQAYEGKGKRVVELVFVADDETRCIVL